MEQIIMLIMAAGALLGGLDRLLGNRWGLGAKFEEGFQLLGSVALAQAGIICLAPVLSNVLGPAVKAVYHAIGQDPSMFGSILAMDMGGYQMAAMLADDALVGRFSGIVAASMLGCTVSFTIPVGMGFLPAEKQDAFARGIMYGLMVMPGAMVLGALLCGLPLLETLWLCLPVLLMAVLLGVGLMKCPAGIIRGFRVFSGGVNALITIGLTLGAVQYMTGWNILPGLTPLEEAMKVVSSIGIVMLGSLPVAELLQRLLKRPIAVLGKRIGMTETGMVSMLITFVTVTPVLATLKHQEETDITVNAAFAVCGASCLAAHLGVVLAVDRGMTGAMVISKLAGGVCAAAVAMLLAAKHRAVSEK